MWMKAMKKSDIIYIVPGVSRRRHLNGGQESQTDNLRQPRYSKTATYLSNAMVERSTEEVMRKKWQNLNRTKYHAKFEYCPGEGNEPARKTEA